MSPDPPLTPSPLDPPTESIRAMAHAAVDWYTDYLATLPQQLVYPATSSRELRLQLVEPLPEEGRDFADLLETFTEVVAKRTRHNGHPRSFGYVTSPATAVAVVADFLASGLDANVTAWRSAPAPVELERLAVGWVAAAIGCESLCTGLFVSGGSMGNLVAIAAARERATNGEAARLGLRAGARQLVLYTSAEAHHSIDKAAAMLGIGRDNLRRVSVDTQQRLDVDALERAIALDRAAGNQPFCLVATAGTVATGAVDPLPALGELAQREGLWFHVDGAYGGFAAMAPSARPLFAGLDRADSITLDPHKWLYQPVDCGCVLVRDQDALRQAFALEADYTRILGRDGDEAVALWDYGPELTRRLRALKVWMTIAHVGRRGLAEAIEADLDHASTLARLIEASDDLELLAHGLSIVCLRVRGAATLDESDRDTLNQQILLALQQAGSSYLSNATVDGHFALRACIVNYRTTAADIEQLLVDVRQATRAVEASARPKVASGGRETG